MDKDIEKYFSNNGWNIAEEKSVASKCFTFKNFKLAISWMIEVGIEAECLDHHPNWTNIYNKVEVDLQTHDAGCITKKDLELAEYMDEAFKKFL